MRLNRRAFIASLISAAGFVKAKCFGRAVVILHGSNPGACFHPEDPGCRCAPVDALEFILETSSYEIDRASFDAAKAVCDQIVTRDTIGDKIRRG